MHAIRIFLLALLMVGCTTTYEEHHHYNVSQEGPVSGEKPMPNDDSELLASERDGLGHLLTGRSKVVDMVCGNTAKFGSMQAEFGGLGVYTVQFDLTPPARDPLIGGVFACEAVIDWSMAGNTISRRVTVSDGMSITGNAEHVNVRVYDRTTDVVLAGSNEPYQVAMTVTRGARSTSSVAPVYEPNPAVTLIPLAGFFDVTVPDDIGANSVMVVSSSPPQPDLSAANAQQRCSAALVGLLYQWDPYAPRFVPLSPNALFVRVNAAPGLAVAKVVFGIDG